ncbi:AAA family ATPase [Magnetococcus sp. PR-3]|uniref:AAA family ATPase n=1 Tax=Magnetococcus sp. PR-3 TaxID=3120355 RepID=UPI002FCE353D
MMASAPPTDPVPASQNRGVAYGELYLEFLGLTRPPFPVVPDAENFYLPSRLDALIAEITHGILTRKGFMVITGEVGCGKTTITRRILHTLENHPVESALIINTFYQGVELIEEICHDFGIPLDDDGGLGNRLKQLNLFLIEKHQQGQICTIIFDDAQNLSHESLELIRMISNLETEHEKLVQILLVGQSELTDRLDEHAMRQLKSRIVIHGQVTPFNPEEMKQYIHFRLNRAGSGGVIAITEQGYRQLFNWTGGNPRLINKLMDRCLYGLFADNTTRIEAALVDGVASEVGLTEQWGAPPEVHKPHPQTQLLIRYMLSGVVGGALVVGGLYLAGLLGSGSVQTAKGDQVVTMVADAPKPVVKAEPVVPPAPASEPQRVPLQTTAAASQPVSPPQPIKREKDSVQAESLQFYAAVHHFLSDKGLQRHTKAYMQALREGWLETLAHRIWTEEQYRLVRLPVVSKEVRQEYLLLKYNDPTRGEEFHLFWKPSRWLDPKQVGPRNETSARFQRMLALTPFYSGLPDGMIGPGTLAAVKAFQRAFDLHESGQPDAATQFVLEHYVRKQMVLAERLKQRKQALEAKQAREQRAAASYTDQATAHTVSNQTNTTPVVDKRSKEQPRALAEGMRYAVQVATFQTVRPASKLAQMLRGHGLSAYVQKLPAANGGSWHVVRLGPWGEGRLAVMARDRVKKQFKLSAIIVQVKAVNPTPEVAIDGGGSQMVNGGEQR